MTLRLIFCGAGLALVLTLAGCVPSAQSQSDEEKESHFLQGKSRVSTMDYSGAVEAFEKALEVNPHSAAAHFELGCLFETKQPDPAAAIYHFQKFLKLRPEAPNSDVVNQRMATAKQELAKNTVLAPLTERQQRELEQLMKDVKELTEKLKQAGDERDAWRASFLRLQPLTNAPSRGAGLLAERPAPGAAQPANLSRQSGRTHTVKAGETLSAIAKKYGLRLDSLSSANPTVDAHRLRVGTVLQLPGA